MCGIVPAQAHHHNNAGAFVGGLIAGAVIGGAAVAATQPRPYYYPPYPAYPPPYGYCLSALLRLRALSALLLQVSLQDRNRPRPGRRSEWHDTGKLSRISVAATVLAVLSCYAQAQETPAAPPADQQHLPPYDCTLTEAVLCKAGRPARRPRRSANCRLRRAFSCISSSRVLAGVSADGLPHVSTMSSIARSGDIVVAQGVDSGTGWMVHSTSNDDEVTFVAASDDFIINAFGTCKPLGVAQ